MASKIKTDQIFHGKKPSGEADDLIGTAEASNILDVSVSRVQQFFWNKRLPGTMFANRIVFRRADVLEFAKAERLTGRPHEEN